MDGGMNGGMDGGGGVGEERFRKRHREGREVERGGQVVLLTERVGEFNASQHLSVSLKTDF